MATSYAHKFGQIVGEMLEVAIEPLLRDFANKYCLYLDKRGPRPARSGLKVTWTDLNGNKHDLDFVLEREGSDTQLGTPAAFIETAWRRYTKHSRNKAQEIQGAIIPLAETYECNNPFLGVVLAGIFTEGSLSQLRSLGFTVLYFSYETVIEAFKRIDIDASFDEHTPEIEFKKKITKWNSSSLKKHKEVAAALITINSIEVTQFVQSLERTITRRIKSVRILPLHGTP